MIHLLPAVGAIRLVVVTRILLKDPVAHERCRRSPWRARPAEKSLTQVPECMFGGFDASSAACSSTAFATGTSTLGLSSLPRKAS